MHDDNDDNNNNTYNGNNGNNSNKYNHHHRHHHHHLPKWYGTSQAGSHLHDNGPSYPCKTHTARGPVILAPAKKNRGSPVDDMHVNQNCSNGKVVDNLTFVLLILERLLMRFSRITARFLSPSQ